jgi:putative restriction endonuclease
LNEVDGAKVALTASYSPKSISALKDSIHYAWFEESLWRQLSNPKERASIRQLLLRTYFPQSNYRKSEIERETANYVRQLELNFLENRAAEPLEKNYRMVEYEARSAYFKTAVPKIYNYTCAISGMRVTATTDVQLVDACHIEPWSRTKNDTIQNGITLTPTLHRAFDRHLISIDQDYRVVVSSNITEEAGSPYGIRQFAGKRILLPEKKEWWPGREAIAKHRSGLI